MSEQVYGIPSRDVLNHYDPEEERADDETKIERLEKAIQHALTMGGKAGEDRVPHLLLDKVNEMRRKIDDITVEHEYGPDDGEWRMDVSSREDAIEYVLDAVDDTSPEEGEPSSPLERAIINMETDLEGLQETARESLIAEDLERLRKDPNYYGVPAGFESSSIVERESFRAKLARKMGVGSTKVAGLEWNNPDPDMINNKTAAQDGFSGNKVA